MHRARVFTGVLASLWVALFVVACQDQPASPTANVDGSLRLAKSSAADDAAIEAIASAMGRVNAELASERAEYQVAVAEYVTAGDDGEHMGQTVFANNRGNKQLSSDFVPGDPRRGGGTDILWVIDNEGTTTSGPTAAQTNAAIGRAMQTWQDVTCSNLPLTDLGVFPGDLGIVQDIFGFGGDPNLFTDVMHTGWLPGAFFDLLAPGGSTFILGVTFTFIWIEVPSGNPTDIDGNGKTDVAFREIYYNDAFAWGDPGNTGLGSPFDVETVALHEAGHGLSQGHFGKIFRTNSNGQLHFAPRAVMNAAISGQNVVIEGTDLGGHCSNWAEWPNN